jgi:5-methyltetrahydropteroyltriglutamate--homocysteine methyltransferase
MSDDRILTTHVGSLPRPKDLADALLARHLSGASQTSAFDDLVKSAVEKTVAAQIETGLDIINDGEMSKLSYTFYLKERVSGIADDERAREKSRDFTTGQDDLDHPDFAERRRSPFDVCEFPACVGPVHYENMDPVKRDIANLKAASQQLSHDGVFMTAASPGVLTKFLPDVFYGNEETYLEALSNAMKVEYEAIHGAGFMLQIDCPDLCSSRHNQYRRLSGSEFLRIVDRNIAALNHATANIPADRMRMHLCWGNYDGPHTHDIPLTDVIERCFRARPAALCLEGANPRHAHEWEDLKSVRIPEDRILIPGCIETTNNFVEHPRLIAQRLCNYAGIVGRDRIIAGADCGFATVAGRSTVAPSIVWAKLRALVEGAQIASDRLWQ